MMEIQFCTCCLQDLDHDPYIKTLYEIICEFYCTSKLPFLGEDNEAMRRLENLGYVVSTEMDQDFIVVQPVGYYYAEDKCLFCRDPAHF